MGESGEENNMISIIIPTYNHRGALQKCLASIVAQTYSDYEIIIVDDGSTDGTYNSLLLPLTLRGSDLPAGKAGTGLQVLRHEKNLGANAARNRGWKEATGEYVLFCDADVVMQPQMLERMMRTLAEHAEASYVYSSFKFGWKTFRLWPFDAEKLRRMPYIHSTSLVRRAHMPKGGWDESLRRLQDWDFFLTMFEEGHTGIWIPEVLFMVEARKSGMSQWLPSFAYKLSFLPSVKRYRVAEAIIRAKHHCC